MSKMFTAMAVAQLAGEGRLTGVSNQVGFYPDLGYVFVVLGNSDASGTEAMANHVRALIASSASRSCPR